MMVTYVRCLRQRRLSEGRDRPRRRAQPQRVWWRDEFSTNCPVDVYRNLAEQFVKWPTGQPKRSPETEKPTLVMLTRACLGLARNGHCGAATACPLSEAKRKTST